MRRFRGNPSKTTGKSPGKRAQGGGGRRKKEEEAAGPSRRRRLKKKKNNAVPLSRRVGVAVAAVWKTARSLPPYPANQPRWCRGAQQFGSEFSRCVMVWKVLVSELVPPCVFGGGTDLGIPRLGGGGGVLWAGCGFCVAAEI